MGVNAIAAVAVFFPILFCLLAFVIASSSGATVLVGQAWGAQNIEKVRCVVGSTPVHDLNWRQYHCPVGGVSGHILLGLRYRPDVMHLSLPYVQWMMASSPLLFIYIYTSILRGVGDSPTPLIASGMTIVIGLFVTPGADWQAILAFRKWALLLRQLPTAVGYLAVLIFWPFT